MTRRIHLPPSARLTSRRRWLVNGVGLGLWLTGAVWLLLHYFFMRQGEFGPEHSPLEGWTLKAHAAFAFLALWTLGLLWGVHVVNGWRLARRRWTGGVLMAVMGLLSLSGYLLYYAGDDQLRTLVSVAHWTVGLAVFAAYLVHRLLPEPTPAGRLAADQGAPFASGRHRPRARNDVPRV